MPLLRLLAVGVASLIIGCAPTSSSGSYSDRRAAERQQREDARLAREGPASRAEFAAGSEEVTAAINGVRAILLSPSTATFSTGTESTSYRGTRTTNGYKYVSDAVDAQNAFGAMIRRYWWVKLGPDDRVLDAYLIGDEVDDDTPLSMQLDELERRAAYGKVDEPAPE